MLLLFSFYFSFSWKRRNWSARKTDFQAISKWFKIAISSHNTAFQSIYSHLKNNIRFLKKPTLPFLIDFDESNRSLFDRPENHRPLAVNNFIEALCSNINCILISFGRLFFLKSFSLDVRRIASVFSHLIRS